MHARKILVSAAILLALLAPPRVQAASPLDADINSLITAAKLNKAVVGVSVVDVETGNVLCAINDDQLLIPASNAKLLTTAAGLILLGDDYQFTTSLYAAGSVEQGVLNGHLVVAAGGDPAISGREHDGQVTAVFDSWAAAVARSIQIVRGNLIIDDTAFDREYIHPAWPADQLVRWYCAPISAFALNDNCIDVSVKPADAAGQPAVVTLSPPTEYFEVRNTCTTVASGPAAAYISRLPGKDVLVISGKLTPGSAGAGSPVTVVQPALFAATILKERLAAAGVRVEGDILFAREPIATGRFDQLASSSHSLVTAVRTANKNSQNFYAEMILKTLGRTVAQLSSFAAGIQAAAKALETAGIKAGTYTLDDGSGLSRRDAVSPGQVTTLLRYMAQSSHADAYVNSLPVAGVDGSLRRRMNQPPTAGKVLAKTGHLRGVSALSGYIRTDGKWLAFSILINGDGVNLSAADDLQDAICRRLVELPE